MLIIVVGKSGAGKSEFIRAMNCPDKRYSSSGLIKEEVKRRGMDVNHDTCQIVADDLYRRNIYWQIPFILHQVEKNDFLLLDGARKIAEVRRLMELCPKTFVLAIEAIAPIRFKRLRLRDGISEIDFDRMEQDETEKTDILQLLEMADAVIKNNNSAKDLQRKAVKFVLLFNHQ